MFKALFYILSALYPLIVFTCLVVLRVPARAFSLFVIFVALVYFLFATGGKDKKRAARLLLSSALLLAAGVVCLVTGSALFLKLYPVLISGIFLCVFGYTLFAPPAMSRYAARLPSIAWNAIAGALPSSGARFLC